MVLGTPPKIIGGLGVVQRWGGCALSSHGDKIRDLHLEGSLAQIGKL